MFHQRAAHRRELRTVPGLFCKGQLVEMCGEVPGWERQDARALRRSLARRSVFSTSCLGGIKDTLSLQTSWPRVPLPIQEVAAPLMCRQNGPLKTRSLEFYEIIYE